MSAPRPHLESTVRVASGSDPFTLEPCIEDMLETQHCTPGSVLQVEGIDEVNPISPRYRAVRLLLGDGELCIQALAVPEMHHVVNSRRFHLGCYVRLDWFELRFIPIRPIPIIEGLDSDLGLGDYLEQEAGERKDDDYDDDDEEQEEEQEGEQEEVFLIVRDMSVVGWDPACVQMTAESRRQTIQPLAQRKPLVVFNPQVEAIERARDDKDSPPTSTTQRPLALREGTTAEHINSSKPLKLTPLRSIPNLPYKQNWVVNVLAVVTSLSGVELAILPPNKQPFKQRTARLADPSTSKQVLLTVFLDPEAFTPAVGSVVLLLAVKNHRFDGGSLKKYGNEVVKDRSTWWVENPQDIEGCDVDGLARWWAEKSSKGFVRLLGAE
ncbi:hypothetical protein M406DRAFT_345969 [Cryphonectria parasitica EP155]|uniref:Uncharacterized protein n=1 Tax=Cryphonectria parasitica (strain ATCC 38755 / EP155) TaxID=660469 RepID=A0A9P4Y3X1_CRYP1|nr:uncharacterized protein M406DRAFT_345969 [Cryphonectria parasitica EP155]KAF3765690.1 hypothetical protein M406DRAFT_345969 [Cryphonectria parasitica EP155]